MAPLFIFTFTLVIVERDTAKVYILQNWTSGDPYHFSRVTWQTTTRGKWQGCIVRTFILKHVPNKLENSDSPKSILREVPWPKRNVTEKKVSTSPCCDFEKKNRGFVASKDSSRQKPIRTTRSSMSCASALWELCLRCLLPPDSPRNVPPSLKTLFWKIWALCWQQKCWHLKAGEKRRCYLYKGFCMLVSWRWKVKTVPQKCWIHIGCKEKHV